MRIAGRSAVEVGLITSEAPKSLRVAPYLALNRDPFNVPVARSSTKSAFSRTRSRSSAARRDRVGPELRKRRSSWMTWMRGSASNREDGRTPDAPRRPDAEATDEVLDQGLPVSATACEPSRWSRMSATYAYGKYRHTMVVVKSGQGKRRADLHAPGCPRRVRGSWNTSSPSRSSGSAARMRKTPGVWNITLEDDFGSTRDLTFDAGGGETGLELAGHLRRSASSRGAS